MSTAITEDQLIKAISTIEKKFNEKLDELQKILVVTQSLSVGNLNDPTKQVVIEDGKVDGRMFLKMV